MQLSADCGACAALCCVLTFFEASEEFAIDKPAGVACRFLEGHACAIHRDRRALGFSGCIAFECYGAGQRVTREVPGAEWPTAFPTLREVHELLWLLRGAKDLAPTFVPRLDALAQRITLAGLAIDVAAASRETHALLREIGRVWLPMR